MNRVSVEMRVGLTALLLSALAVGLTLLIVWLPWSPVAKLAAGLVAALVVIECGRRLAVFSLKPIGAAATVVEALRDGDYALRFRSGRSGVLGDLAYSINALADLLHGQAAENRESGLLLAKVLEEIDLPVFAFREDGQLTLSNPAALSLTGLHLQNGITAEALGLQQFLSGPLPHSVRLVFPAGSGRFLIKRRAFRLQGIPHQLLVMAEVGSVLSAERREAWQSLVRVMSHEINNSLGPIKSIAETWQTQANDPGRELSREALAQSLELIARRAGSLSRFVGVYAGLARLPEPDRKRTQVKSLIEKACALETRIQIQLRGDELEFELDPDQIEQALINLIRNAAEAVESSNAPRTSSDCKIAWQRQARSLVIDVIDNGAGLPESDNLFVPFFTTKPGGSGIGLLLVRRIAELHGGSFELLPREDGQAGAQARLWIAAE